MLRCPSFLLPPSFFLLPALLPLHFSFLCKTFLFPCSLLLPFAIVEKTASDAGDFISVWLWATVNGIGFNGACAPWAYDTSCWRSSCHTPRPAVRMGRVSGMLCFISSIIYLELGDHGAYSPCTLQYNSFLLFDNKVIEECNEVILPADSIQSIKNNL